MGGFWLKKAWLHQTKLIFWSYFSGVHHKKSECTTSKVVSKVQQILAKAKPYLFPDKLQIKPVTTPGKMRKAPNGNGGWGDHRDRKMCVSLSETNATLQLSEQIETGRFRVWKTSLLLWL